MKPAAKGAPMLLALRALGLGDLLTAVPALRALAAAFPDHVRVLATPAALAPLARLTGAVDAVQPAAAAVRPGSSLEPLPGLAIPPDVAVNLHGRGPQSHAVLRAHDPARLIAFAHPDVPGTEGSPAWHPDEHEATRWCRLLAESGIPADPSDLYLEPPPLPAHLPAGVTVLHPGAAFEARRWPAERWAAVALAERADGRVVVLTGAAEEESLARSVADRAGLDPGAVLAGRTSLLDLAALVGAADVVVSGDTGMAHLATALGTPSVVLFGPTSPALWGPPEDSPLHRALWKGVPGDPHADRPSEGLLLIEPEEVLAAVADVRAGRLAAAASRGGTP